MATPTLTTTWYTQGEYSFPVTTSLQDLTRSWLWILKTVLMNELSGGTTSGSRPGGSAWTCEGSSDSSTAGMDGSDRWTSTFTPSKLVRNTEGSAHSWIVLKSPNAMGPVYLLLNYNGGSEGLINITFSSSAYTGGSTTAKPTATNETPYGTATVATAVGVISLESTFNVVYKAGFSCNADGEWFYYTNRVSTGIFNSFLAMNKCVNTSGSDNWPWVLFGNQLNSGRGAGAVANICTTAQFTSRTPNGGARVATGGMVQYYCATSQWAGTMTLDSLQSSWITLPIYNCNLDASVMTWRGNLADAYWVGAATVGGGYPTAASQTQMVVGDLLIPSGVPAAL